MSGWASNSKYAFLGSLRSSAQMISYEVSMGLLIMPVLFLSNTANLSGIFYHKKIYITVFLYFQLVFYFIFVF
jgi:NADH-quinone oxidoreductase subunit H